VTRASGYGERAAALECSATSRTTKRVTSAPIKLRHARLRRGLGMLQVAARGPEHLESFECDRSATTRHAGYEVSQWKRKRVEEISAGSDGRAAAKTRHRGRAR